MTYDFNWDSSVEIDGEIFPSDSLLRAKYASSLSANVVRKSVVGDYVLNVNAGWGYGKTYFLKRWFEDIKATHPSVYVNAWKHDFSAEPLLTVVSELKSQLTNQFSLGEEGAEIDLGALVKAGAPIVAKEITKRFVGIELDEIGERYQSLVGKTSQKVAQLMLEQHEEQISSIHSFRKQLSELATKISETSEQHELPVFVFIDELDRCRPTFAIELLETVKHLFDVKEFVFIIATDTEQLEHSIKAVYGAGFDARSYLSRFFTERVLLPRNSISALLLENPEFGYLFDYNDSDLFRQSKLDVRSLANALSTLFNDYSLPLRGILKLLSRAAFAVNSLANEPRSVDPLFLVLLLAIRESSSECYSSLMHEIKPEFKDTESLLSPKKLEKYTVSLIVEPKKLGAFGNQNESATQLEVKLSELFALRRSDMNETTSFAKRSEVLRNKLRNGHTLDFKDVYNLCVLFYPDDKPPLSKEGYNALIEHSMLLE